MSHFNAGNLYAIRRTQRSLLRHLDRFRQLTRAAFIKSRMRDGATKREARREWREKTALARALMMALKDGVA